MFKVTNYKVRFIGKIYGPKEIAGDIIKDLPKTTEKKLQRQGYGFIIESESLNQEGNELIPEDYTIDNVKELIKKTNKTDTLVDILNYEKSHKNRSGAINSIEERITTLKKDIENNNRNENIKINIDPDELIDE